MSPTRPEKRALAFGTMVGDLPPLKLPLSSPIRVQLPYNSILEPGRSEGGLRTIRASPNLTLLMLQGPEYDVMRYREPVLLWYLGPITTSMFGWVAAKEFKLSYQNPGTIAIVLTV